MQQVDKNKFMLLFEEKYGKQSEYQKEGINKILDALMVDERVADLRWSAYMLATTKWETQHTWHPIEEYGKGKGQPYGKPAGPYGHVYYGRGYTQNTWVENYRTLTIVWNKVHPDRPVDFVKNPELLCQHEFAYWAMSYAMRNGAYTGVGLPKYINGEKCDYLNARRIVNRLDQAERIAQFAVAIEDMLNQAKEG